MNKSMKRQLLDRRRRKAGGLSDRPVADRGASFGLSMGFDSSPRNVSVRELEAYLDEAWRTIGTDSASWDE
jgi:hypothetical protein